MRLLKYKFYHFKTNRRLDRLEKRLMLKFLKNNNIEQTAKHKSMDIDQLSEIQDRMCLRYTCKFINISRHKRKEFN